MSMGYDGSTMLMAFLSQLVSNMPLLVIWVVGLVLSLMRLGQDRRYGLMAAAFGIFLLAGLAGSFTGVLVNVVAASADMSRATFALTLFSFGLIFVNCIGWIVLLVALFRRPAEA